MAILDIILAQSAGAVEYRGVRLHPNECPVYGTTQSDREVPVMLELWGMQCAPSLPFLLRPLWPVMVAPNRALSIG